MTALFEFSYVSAQSLDCILNIFLKTIFSTPRPHFLDTCNPDWSKIDCVANGNKKVKFDISLCQNYDDTNYNVIADSMKSFPSGHSQLALCCAVYFMVYLQRRFPSQPLVKMVQALLLGLGVFCAYSRILDHRHHPVDVMAGSTVGALLGFFTASNMISEMLSLKDKQS